MTYPNTSNANGIWTLRDGFRSRKGGLWPLASNDPFFSNVALLLSMDGTNGSTTFTDSSSYRHTVTSSNSTVSTSIKKFGDGSCSFGGNGALSIADFFSFHLSYNDFTFEFWTYLNSTTGVFIHKRASYYDVPYLYFSCNGGTLFFWATSNGSSWDIASGFSFGNTALSTGQWHHVALVRSGSEIANYVNGAKSPNTITTFLPIHNGGNNPIRIGGDPSHAYFLNGYIDDLRITNGIARFSTDFIPPTQALPTYA
jgi:hypothetical protein